jgi:hypothetical protein
MINSGRSLNIQRSKSFKTSGTELISSEQLALRDQKINQDFGILDEDQPDSGVSFYVFAANPCGRHSFTDLQQCGCCISS